MDIAHLRPKRRKHTKDAYKAHVYITKTDKTRCVLYITVDSAVADTGTKYKMYSLTAKQSPNGIECILLHRGESGRSLTISTESTSCMTLQRELADLPKIFRTALRRAGPPIELVVELDTDKDVLLYLPTKPVEQQLTLIDK